MDLKRLARNVATGRRAKERMLVTGLTPSGHRLWQSPEPENLDHSYPDYGAALALNSDRSLPAHHSKAVRMGITRPRPPAWSNAELSAVRHGYGRLTKAELLHLLPRRSWHAICAKGRAMGLQRPMRPYAPTGDSLVDEILLRAWQRGDGLRTLDAEAGLPGYFSRRHWRSDKSRTARLARVCEYLGGRLRADFEPK